MTIWDDLGPHGAAFAELASERLWDAEGLALELYLRGYTGSADTFAAFKHAVQEDTSRFEASEDENVDDANDAEVLRRLRHALLLLDGLTAAFMLREAAKLAAREADRQDAVGRRGAARLAEDEALRLADAGADADA